jgi:hypothetical protein
MYRGSPRFDDFVIKPLDAFFNCANLFMEIRCASECST